MPQRLAIFDHDGVLVDSLAWHQQAWLNFGAVTGLDVTPAFIQDTFGMTNPSIFRLLLGDGYSDELAQKLGPIKEAIYRDLAYDALVLMPGVEQTLRNLRDAGFVLAIGSSGPRANLELTVERCNLQGFFQTLVSLEDVTRGKPDPQVFLIAADRCGITPTPQTVLVMEDAVFGIKAAKAANMRAIGVTTTHSAAHLWEQGADEVHENLVDFSVETLIARMNGHAQ